MNKKRFCHISRSRFSRLLSFILKNTYCEVLGRIFRQIKGIAMGLCPIPVIGDLYLLLYYVKTKLVDLNKAKSVHSWSFAYAMGFKNDWIFHVIGNELIDILKDTFHESLNITTEDERTSVSFTDHKLQIRKKLDKNLDVICSIIFVHQDLINLNSRKLISTPLPTHFRCIPNKCK